MSVFTAVIVTNDKHKRISEKYVTYYFCLEELLGVHH